MKNHEHSEHVVCPSKVSSPGWSHSPGRRGDVAIGRDIRAEGGGISYSQWGHCGLQRGSKTGAPGSASASDDQTAPDEALAQGSLKAMEGEFFGFLKSHIPHLESTSNMIPRPPGPGGWHPPLSAHTPTTILGLTDHQELCPALHLIQLRACHTAIVALVTVVQAVDDQAPIIYEVPGEAAMFVLGTQQSHHFPAIWVPLFTPASVFPPARTSPSKQEAPCTEEARSSGVATFLTLPPSTQSRLGLESHLSLSPSSWRSRPSPRQVMLGCKEGSKEAWHVNVTLEPFFSIALRGPCVIWVASEGDKGERGSL